MIWISHQNCRQYGKSQCHDTLIFVKLFWPLSLSRRTVLLILTTSDLGNCPFPFSLLTSFAHIRYLCSCLWWFTIRPLFWLRRCYGRTVYYTLLLLKTSEVNFKQAQNRQQNKNQIGEGCNMLGGVEHCESQNNGLFTIRDSMIVFFSAWCSLQHQAERRTRTINLKETLFAIFTKIYLLKTASFAYQRTPCPWEPCSLGRRRTSQSSYDRREKREYTSPNGAWVQRTAITSAIAYGW